MAIYARPALHVSCSLKCRKGHIVDSQVRQTKVYRKRNAKHFLLFKVGLFFPQSERLMGVMINGCLSTARAAQTHLLVYRKKTQAF